jgi:tetrapyrrole methylase family protein/MazG family protein
MPSNISDITPSDHAAPPDRSSLNDARSGLSGLTVQTSLLDTNTETQDPVAERFMELVAVVKRLRAECPWDREQTHESLRPMLIEEAYEAVEAIDSRDYTELKKELGDLLLHILFHSELGAENGTFSLKQVIEAEMEKLIYRHPHVFGELKVAGAEDVSRNWEQLKRREKGRNSVLDGVPTSLPALQRAARIQDKASKVGFDWTEKESVWKKVREEILEFEAESDPVRREDEFGDLLFALVNIARHENLEPEGALRQATQKFERRFREVEKEVERSDRPFASYTLEELDAIWDEVKVRERQSNPQEK